MISIAIVLFGIMLMVGVMGAGSAYVAEQRNGHLANITKELKIINNKIRN